MRAALWAVQLNTRANRGERGGNMKKQYLQIKLHGGNCYVQPLSEIHQAIDGELDGLQIGDKITLDFELVEMTEEEYEKLADFAGH